MCCKMNRYFVFILFCVLFFFLSQTQFKSLAEDLPKEGYLLETFSKLIQNYKFYLGLFFFVLSSASWIFGIKGLSLTKATSILSLNYIVIIGYGVCQLNEVLSISRVIATFLILLGILIINLEKSNN